MTDAIVNGKALKIEGGSINVPETSLPECGLGRLCHQVGKRRSTSAKKRNLPEDEGTIALTSIDGTLEGMVDERFGRARKLIVYSPTGGTMVVENQTRRNLGQGAGIQTAQNIIECGVKTVITGHLGPNAFKVLAAAGIDAYSAINMTVAEALNAYRMDSLKRLSDADVPGHWEMERGQGK
jgi:predicted Fe-Mo cluster-binding NifX family protein